MALDGPDDKLLPEPPKPPEREPRFRRLFTGIKAMWKILVGSGGIIAIIAVIVAILTYQIHRNSTLKHQAESVKPISQSVDLNYLENRYPFGFAVFRENHLDSKYEVFKSPAEAIWDIDWKSVTVAHRGEDGAFLDVSVPINQLYVPRLNNKLLNCLSTLRASNLVHLATKMPTYSQVLGTPDPLPG